MGIAFITCGALANEVSDIILPELKPRFFGKYRRVVYLAQTRTPELSAKAERIADYLELPLEIRYTGYGLLEERLVAMVESLNQNRPAPAHGPTSH